jgi:hypothetical protein
VSFYKHSDSQEIPRICGTRRFITVFKERAIRSLCRAKRIQSTSSKPSLPKTKYNIILPSIPGSIKWSLNLRFTTRILYPFLVSPLHAVCFVCLVLDLIVLTTFGEECKFWSSSYAVFSELLSLHAAHVQIFSSAPCSQTSSRLFTTACLTFLLYMLECPGVQQKVCDTCLQTCACPCNRYEAKLKQTPLKLHYPYRTSEINLWNKYVQLIRETVKTNIILITKALSVCLLPCIFRLGPAIFNDVRFETTWNCR